MIFRSTSIQGAFVIELEKHGDDRGFFARTFCENAFRDAGLIEHFVQANNSLSAQRGTLRGMHYQLGTAAETKVIRCIRGSFFDVIVDLRPGSPTFRKWFGETLSAENRFSMYAPKGCAHGFMTLEDDTESFYFVDAFYAPDQERGVRWNDPTFGIAWPMAPEVISDKDATHPDFSAAYHLGPDAAQESSA